VNNSTGNPILSFVQSFQGEIICWLDVIQGTFCFRVITVDQNTGTQWYKGTMRAKGISGDGLYTHEIIATLIMAALMADLTAEKFAAKV